MKGTQQFFLNTNKLHKKIWFIAYLTITCWGYSQNFSDIKVNIIRNATNDSIYKNQIYPVIVEINQQIVLKDFKKRKLQLNLKKGDYNQIFKNLFYQNFKVYSSNSNNLAKYTFNGKYLKISLKNKATTTLHINYLFQSDFGMKNNSTTAVYFIPFMSDWHSWYFTNKSIPLKSVTINIPKEFTLFANKPYSLQNNTYRFQTHLNDTDVSFYLLDNQYYKKIHFISNGITFNTYLFKNIIVDTVVFNHKDSLIPHPAKRVSVDFEKNIKATIDSTTRYLTSIFTDINYPEINIVEASLSLQLDKKQHYTWGRQFQMNQGQAVILIDTSYWQGNSVQHELIHSFSKMPVDKQDSAYYFFAESLVEYLSLVIKYHSADKIDSVFQKRTDKIKALGYDLDSMPSIFDISNNYLNLSGTQNQTNIVIYQKVPLLLHHLAKKSGYNQFVWNLCRFFAVANKSKHVNMPLFEKYIRQNNLISNQEWQNFMETL